jgi:hypothetical protein
MTILQEVASLDGANGDDPPDVDTQLDLAIILDEKWVDLSAFSAVEALQAADFYRTIRRRDSQLVRARAAAVRDTLALTGLRAVEIGSFGIQLNLNTSDLDLGVGCRGEELDRLTLALSPRFRPLGWQPTRFSNLRFAFAAEYENVSVDLSVLSPQDFMQACRMHQRIAESMSQSERIAYTWVKHLLFVSGAWDAYERWKCAPYLRFCSGFRTCRSS